MSDHYQPNPASESSPAKPKSFADSIQGSLIEACASPAYDLRALGIPDESIRAAANALAKERSGKILEQAQAYCLKIAKAEKISAQHMLAEIAKSKGIESIKRPPKRKSKAKPKKEGER